ncbi:INVS [Symbiodinium sp. CCMP2592]|nr:INVS [Symbiodinium sp. CCMP2592]
MARAFLLSDELRIWAGEHMKSISLSICQVAPQKDSWSCGHRVIASADLVLQHLAASGSLPKSLQGPSSEDIAQFMAPASSASASAAAAPAAAGKAAKGTESGPAGASDSESRILSTLASSGEAEIAPSTPKRQKVHSGKEPISPPPVSPAVSRVPRRGKAERRARSKAGKEQEPAPKKMKASECPVSHPVFQKKHCLADMPAVGGHWGIFLQACADPSMIIACPVCCDLLKEVRPETGSAGGASDAGMGGNQVVPAADAAEEREDADSSSGEPEGKRRAGRRRKGEVPSWCLQCLHAWVKARRQDVYVQTDRSYQKSATYYCRPCGKEIQFQTATCKKKILRHEAYKTHIQGLAKLRGTLVQAPSRAGAAIVASDTSQPCSGILASKHALHESITLFVQHGQPRMHYAKGETDPLEAIRFEVLSSDISIRHAKCLGVVGQSMTACSECVQASKAKSFKLAVAKQAYVIDLCMLTHHCYHSTAQELEEFRAALPGRDYQLAGLAGQDLDRYLRIKNNLEVCRAIASKFECTPAWRVSDSLRRLFELWLHRPHRSHSTDTEAEAHSSLVRGMAASLVAGRCREKDLVLAARVAAGALRADVIVQSLCTSFLSKMVKGLRDVRQKTTGEFTDYEVLSESLTTLGRHEEVVNLLKTFKVNPKKLKVLSLHNDRYPLPYACLSNKAQIRENCLRAASHLRNVRGLTMNGDGTLQDAWDPDQDYSILDPASHDKHSLPADRLAKLAMHVCMQRCDNRSWVFDILVVPRAPAAGKACTASETLEMVADVFQEATTAAGGVAPHGLAFDGGSNNQRLLQIFLGHSDLRLQESLPFFKDCVIDDMLQQLPFWPHRFLRHDHRILVAFNGAYHYQKRYSLAHLAGCRKIRHGALFADLSIELCSGLPHSAYLVSDAQSDLAAAQRMSTPFVGRQWQSPGVLLHAFVGALICSCTTASPGFSREDLCLNAMSAMYLLLLHRAEAARQWPEWAERNRKSLSDITVKNGVALMHFVVVACLCDDTEPRSLQELAIEHHFGRLKVLQLSRMPEAALQERCSSFARPALDMDTLKNIAKKALRTALEFQCFISVDTAPSELYGDFQKWWRKQGMDLFRSPDAAANAFDLFDITPELEEDLEPPAVGDTKEQRAATEVLHQVQDRAQLIADIKAMENPDAQDIQDEAGKEDEEKQVVPQQADKEPHESPPEAVAAVPTSLSNVLQAAKVNGGDIFDLDSASAAGQTAMLQRVLHMSGFLRSFIRHARAQEGLLSLSTLNSQPAPLNSWNEREHQLAIARRAANVSQVRLSRAQAWQSSQQRLAVDVRPRNSLATEADPGLSPPTTYFPCGKDRFQIVAHLWGGQVGIGLILTVFRGALVKKPNSSELTVRTARPFPDDLPCASTRMVHIAGCIFNPTTAEYATSCAELCMLCEPVNCIYGELSLAAWRSTKTQLLFRLTPAAAAALKILQAEKKLPIQPIPETTEQTEEDTAAPAPAMSEPSDLQFNDRSFMCQGLAQATSKFLLALEECYRKKGFAFVDASTGLVHFEKVKSTPWKDLVQRVPGFLQVEFAGLQGHRFSRAVHSKFSQLLPTNGPESVKALKVFLGLVASKAEEFGEEYIKEQQVEARTFLGNLSPWPQMFKGLGVGFQLATWVRQDGLMPAAFGPLNTFHKTVVSGGIRHTSFHSQRTIFDAHSAYGGHEDSTANAACQAKTFPLVSPSHRDPILRVPDKMGNTPLHYAAKSGFNEMVKMLLPRRAAIDGKNRNGWTPLHWACATGHSDVATTLIAAKAAVAIQDLDGRTEAMWAAKHGHSEALAVLLDRGFDLNICDKFGMAVADHAQDHLELRMSLLEAEQRNQQLLQAAQRGSKDSAVEALEEGAYVDARDEQGWTALVWSMMGCCVDLVIVLAQHSADPNVLNECSEVLDHLQLQGDQVRHALEAALAGGLGAGERLLAAARNNNFQVVKVELEVGAQVNSQTREQLFTSLIFAAAHCNYQVQRRLLF